MKKAKKRRQAKGARRKEKKWGVGDFVDSVWSTMEAQAEKNKHLKQLHAKLSPEWNKVVQSASQLLEAKSDADVTKHIEEICSHGEKAVRPLIDIVLKLRSAVDFFDKKTCDKTPDE